MKLKNVVLDECSHKGCVKEKYITYYYYCPDCKSLISKRIDVFEGYEVIVRKKRRKIGFNKSGNATNNSNPSS